MFAKMFGSTSIDYNFIGDNERYMHQQPMKSYNDKVIFLMKSF